MRTQRPVEISTHLADRSAPPAAPKDKTYVCVLAGVARGFGRDVTVTVEAPPPDHAEIRLLAADGTTFETEEDLRANDAALFARYHDLCAHLALHSAPLTPPLVSAAAPLA